jgi:hypothetical protein
MLQLFLQTPDRSTATRRGRSHFKKTSFHDDETPLCSTADFHDAETPLFIIFPDAETPLFTLFIFSHSQNTPVRHFIIIFIDETTPSSNCFASSLPLLKHRYQQPFIIFPDAETPLFNTFHFLPLPKHSSSPFHHHFHRRNNSVQQLFRLFPSVAETPLPATFHHFSRC